MSGACAQCGTGGVREGRKYCSQDCYWMSRRSPLRQCAACGAAFAPRKRDQQFCSRECFAASLRDRASSRCECCGRDFEVRPSEQSRRFCSLTCKGAAQRQEPEPRLCAVCAKPMERRRGPRRLESNAHYAQRVTCSRKCARVHRLQVLDTDPHTVGRRTLLARTCRECGELCPGASFSSSGSGHRGFVCGSCKWQGLDETQRAIIYGRDSRRNAKFVPIATHYGEQWTGPQLELVVTRTDLTNVELAKMLGRTPAAISTARQKAKTDPKWMQVAGVST